MILLHDSLNLWVRVCFLHSKIFRLVWHQPTIHTDYFSSHWTNHVQFTRKRKVYHQRKRRARKKIISLEVAIRASCVVSGKKREEEAANITITKEKKKKKIEKDFKEVNSIEVSVDWWIWIRFPKQFPRVPFRDKKSVRSFIELCVHWW